jgi:hypothetical protein
MGTKLSLDSISLYVLLYNGLLNSTVYFQKATRKNYECFHHKELINEEVDLFTHIWTLHNVYLYCNITQYPKYVSFLCINLKKDSKKLAELRR